MRYFDNFPEKKRCPICGTNENKECFLMPIDETTKGNICEAIPVHRNCIGDIIIPKLRLNREHGVIYFREHGRD